VAEVFDYFDTHGAELHRLMGKHAEIDGEVTEYERNQAIAFSGKGPHIKSVKYRHLFEKSTGGTRVIAETEYEPGDDVHVAPPHLQRLVHGGVDHSLSRLKDHLENPDHPRHRHQHLPRHEHHESELTKS
jgi:hypothetical protein